MGGLKEKFLDRISRADSIEQAETVAADVDSIHGLTEAEFKAIREALDKRFDQLADDSLDEVIADAGPQMVQQLKVKEEEKQAIVTRAREPITLPETPMLTDEQVAAAIHHIELFQDLKRKLLDPRVDILYIGSDGKPVSHAKRKEASVEYIKRSGWRKFGLAFNLNIHVLEMWKDWEEDSHGKYYVWNARVRVEHPAGKYVESIGVCSSRDPFFAKRGDRYIEPDEKNIKLKSETVGINRGISDLIGGGVMSAEETEGRR
ncbi:MAG: hypothetical protein V3U30_03665 [Thermoplasmata archaeon]